MSKHSHISAIFDNAFQSRAGSPDVYMSMFCTVIDHRWRHTIQYNKNLFKHGKIIQYTKKLKLIYKIAVWESLSI